ncbi:MAG: lipoyl synthase [Pirellulales bacterium]|nr:lipoyl synthase [Pirellulales bacterium]
MSDPPSPRRLPRWLKRNVPAGPTGKATAGLIHELGLATVCDHARCPNRMECYARKTATFMILGDVCTRGCAFCGVARGEPRPVDPDEPRRVALAVKRLGLRHVVVTCVTRDDLADGGAEHFCRTIEAIRAACAAAVEVLPSDLGGNVDALDRLADARPDVYNHNAETVPRLYPQMRTARANYRWTLAMFRRIKRRHPTMRTKTGLMLGLGETRDELLDTLAELREAGCEMLTLGQYLQPAPDRAEVVRYVPPEEFDELGRLARAIGFDQVAAGPFVRSSYRAGDMAERSPS